MAIITPPEKTETENTPPVTPEIRIGEIIRQVRKAKRISQYALAESLGVTRGSIQNWEGNANEPSLSMLPRICNALGITLADLLGIPTTYSACNQGEITLLHTYRELSEDNKRITLALLKALYEEELRIEREKLEAIEKEEYETHNALIFHPAKAAAGTGIELYDSSDATFKIVNITDENSEADGIVEISGDSMEPKYSDGAWLYYKDAEVADAGDIVLASTSDGYVVKKFGEDGKLHSINPQRPFNPDTEDFVVHIEGIIIGEVQPEDLPSPEDEKRLEGILAQDIEDVMYKIREKQTGY